MKPDKRKVTVLYSETITEEEFKESINRFFDSILDLPVMEEILEKEMRA